MHPNATFRPDDRALHEALLEEVGFGMVFATTPEGPRVAHVPLVSTGDGAVQFHLSRGNALTQHLAGETALVVVNGPDAYVSPRWYDNRDTAPTWNYVALELEGHVRRMDQDGLEALLHSLGEKHEARLAGGMPWTAGDVSEERWRKLLGGIVGFELEVLAWRPTFKLSQDKTPAERQRIADALEAQGAPALAQLMRTLAP
ncbi:MAG: FMN-binding negative transcriptional regulator [Sphingomonadaceae bacterium]|nr:FMN-binding negative transcriptional regulator [Sphingomonadaceae bacterium]